MSNPNRNPFETKAGRIALWVWFAFVFMFFGAALNGKMNVNVHPAINCQEVDK